MQFRHFQASPAGGCQALGHPYGADKTEKPSQPWNLIQFVRRFFLMLDRLSNSLKELGGMLFFVIALLFAMHTFYMPTIFFMKIHESASQVDPMNLQGPEYFVYYNCFLLAVFLQSYVVFALCRALAVMDGVRAPKDILIGYFRSTTSVQTHWNNFHVSWRQFFFRYIVMQNKETFHQGSASIDLAVFMFSAFLHSEMIWYLYFFYYFAMYQVEKLLLRWRRFRDGDAFLRGSYQSLLLSMNFFFFPAVILVESPKKGDLHYSTQGIKCFFLFGIVFFYFNCRRIQKTPDSFF